MLCDKLGRWQFWLFVIGFEVTFFRCIYSVILGMQRPVYSYTPDRGWDFWNLVSSLGVIVQAAAIAIFIWNVIDSIRSGEKAGDDPWDGWTLEWATSSPPPEYNFEKLPVVRSSRPLWDLKHPHDPDWKFEQ